MTAEEKRNGSKRQGGEASRPRVALCALCLCLFLSFTARPALAQFFCEWPIVPPIATGIVVLVNNELIDAALSPSDAILPDLMNQVTMAVMGYTAGDVGVGAAAALGGTAAAGIQIPGISGITDAAPAIGSLADAFNFATNSKFYGGMGFMDDVMRYRLDKFWNDFHGALRGFSQQVYASSINNARLLASIDDVGGMSASALFHQEAEIESKRQHQVSNQACQFDTASTALGRARAQGVDSMVGFAQQVNDIGHSTAGTPAATGASGFRNRQFQWYLNNGCDVNSNGGMSPCTMNREPQGPVVPGMSLVRPAFAQAPPPPLPQANMAVSPDRAIFEQDTIDVTDSEVLEALHYLQCNIVDCTPPPTVPPGALDTAKGDEKLQRIRKYITRIDALTALVAGVIGDRMPAGDPTTPGTGADVQAARMKMGVTTASATPSVHEMRRALIDSLNDPNYYMDLGDAGGTIGQKEIFLKAYNNMLLFDLIEKQEKLAGAYAIETAHMIENMRNSLKE